jgi:hypothetical protein
MSIETTANDKINLKIYTGQKELSEYYIFDESPDKSSSFAGLDFRGRDEVGNFMNIIYHGQMTVIQ